MRVLIAAFEAQPNVGTEAGMAWQWASAYRSLGLEVAVVTKRTLHDPRDDALWVGRGIELVELGQRTSVRASQTPLQLLGSQRVYDRWCREVRRHVEQNRRVVDFVHHVAWSSVRIQPSAQPVGDLLTVWGPLGGGQKAILRGVRANALAHELVRNASFRYSRRRQIAAMSNGSPSITYVTNQETFLFAESIGISFPKTMLADGLSADSLVDIARSAPRATRLLWLGRFVGSKRPDLAIRVLDLLRASGMSDAFLTMAGTGPEERYLRRVVGRCGLSDHVEFAGKVPWKSTRLLYDKADLLLFTSMRDSSAPTILEAASRGLPSVALRKQGVASMVPPSVALGPTNFRTPMGLAHSLAREASALLSDPERYASASGAALDFANRQTWSSKVDEVLRDVRELAGQ
jgi:glycosyltransferase involved in cell wall biosynthesis